MLRHQLRHFIPYPCTRCDKLQSCPTVPRSHVPPAFCDALPPRRGVARGALRRRPGMVTATSIEDQIRAQDASMVMRGFSGSDGALRFISRRWCEVTGQSEADYRGIGWFDAVHPSDHNWLLRTLRGQEPLPADGIIRYGLRLADRTWGRLAVHLMPSLNETGDLLGFHGREIGLGAFDDFADLAGLRLPPPAE